MAYTPELSYRSSCTLRRIAWALNTPMTKAMERIFDHLTEILDREKVCEGCRDKTRCDDCVFNNNNSTDYKEDYING
jgi:recombinational DNA repair protein RecR